MKKIKIYAFLLLLSIFISCEVVSDSVKNYNNYSDLKLNTMDNTEDFAFKGQALLGGYDLESTKNVTEHITFDNLPDFLHSKPSVDANGIKIYSYKPTFHQRFSEYDQTWYKFKSPDAIDSKISLEKVGNRVKPEKVLELAFNEARKLVPEAAAAVDQMGYRFTFASQNMVMGILWQKENITLELRGNNEIFIKTPTLISDKIIPKIGGMTYCKGFSPENAAKILMDLATGNHDRIPFQNPDQAPLSNAAGPKYSSTEVQWNGLFDKLFSQKALLFVDKRFQASGNFKGTFIICPGGYIPAVSMRGIAKSVASKGYIVYIIKYFDDNAFWETITARENSDINLATLIKSNSTDKLNGLFPEIKDFYKTTSAPVIAFGHSQGGAALGHSIFGMTNPFDHIITYGSLSYMMPAKKSGLIADNVSLLLGTNENKDFDKIKTTLSLFEIKTEPDPDGIFRSTKGNRSMGFVEGLNHFCVISDINTGLTIIKKNDGPGPFPSDAAQILADYLVERGLL